ncbi:MAG: shikimate kinase [Clostridia bacterium]|nr:shikimate kinase [Clostridia bacterium]
MKNLVLIGMPGAGKSTVGVLLAKSMLMNFCDTDLLIQNFTGESLSDTIKSRGIDAFIRLEDEIIYNTEFKNSVIATGGSAVYGERAMNKLRENGKIVYLRVSPVELNKRVNNIHTRGIAMKEGTTLAELYEERAPLYEKYADIIIECDGKTPEECVDLIM